MPRNLKYIDLQTQCSALLHYFQNPKVVPFPNRMIAGQSKQGQLGWDLMAESGEPTKATCL